ncbi:hypothetical protein MKX01_031372 [Papaver californicum]|nr:hypothetical protein MKX01_031372 [Papaver californicum]
MAMIRASPITGLTLVPRPSYSSSSSSSNRVTFSANTHPNRCICRGALGTRMNLFNRFARVSYVDSILSVFEDPEKIIEQIVVEMKDDLIKMRQATAQVLASQKRLETKQKAAQQASEEWYRRAQLALEKGDEDLAREALKRRKFYADNATSLKTQLDQQKNVVDNLISNTRQNTRGKVKKDTLKARAQSAKFVLNSFLVDLYLLSYSYVSLMMMESEAEALNQLTTDLEGKFAYLESSSDDDLANLKKEISGRAVFPSRQTVLCSTSFYSHAFK